MGTLIDNEVVVRIQHSMNDDSDDYNPANLRIMGPEDLDELKEFENPNNVIGAEKIRISELRSVVVSPSSTVSSFPSPQPPPFTPHHVIFTVPTIKVQSASLNTNDKILDNFMKFGVANSALNFFVLGVSMFASYFIDSHPDTPAWNFVFISSLIYSISFIFHVFIFKITRANIENDTIVAIYISFHILLLLCYAAMFISFLNFLHQESGFIQFKAVKLMIALYVVRLGGCVSFCSLQ